MRPIDAFVSETHSLHKLSLFLNRILLNSEAWYSISKSNIEELEKIDNILLKKIFEIPSSTPSAIKHLDLNTKYPSYKIYSYHEAIDILTLNSAGIMNKFLMAQITETVKGDWWENILLDLSHLKLNFSLYDIKSMSKEKFKNVVIEAASREAFAWLLSEKSKKKKIQNIIH